MGIKGSVAVKIDAQGTSYLIPPMGELDRNIQYMQWSLDAPEQYRFAKVPIVFQSTDLPPGFIPWTGTTPSRENDWQVRANAEHKVNKGDPPVYYRYDIFVERTVPQEDGSELAEEIRLAFLHPATLDKIDPDMENNPQP